MKTEKLIDAFEAVLYAGGEPISNYRLSQVFEITPVKVVKIMDSLGEKMQKKR